LGDNPVIEQVMVLFLIMIVGMIAAKRGIINKEVRKRLSELLLYITSPFLVVLSFNFKFSPDMLINAGIVFAFSFAIHGFTAILGRYLFVKFPLDKEKVLRFIIVFSNCGFMGFPVAESLYGRMGVFYASIYNVVFHIFVWTYGVMLFSSDRKSASIKKAFLNPGMFSVAIGMAIFLFSLELPKPIVQTLDMVGSMTAPLSMLIIGALLADTDLKKIFIGWDVYYGSLLRLLIIPLMTIVMLKPIGVDRDLLRICVVLTAMPAAANTVIFAERYGANSVLASRCVALSTILSIVTIPLIMMLT
jgi:predicted permease